MRRHEAMRQPLQSSPPCIQVLTFDRAESLRRLLSQLNTLDYGPDAGRVWLRINIDAPAPGASQYFLVHARPSSNTIHVLQPSLQLAHPTSTQLP